MKSTASTDTVLAELLRMTCEDAQRMSFVCNAIVVYFRRIVCASPRKLTAAGMSCVADPLTAELSLQRVAHMDFSAAFLVRLIADNDTARLAWRAVKFYSARYAAMDFEALSAEVGEGASDVMAVAGTIHFMLTVADDLA